MAQSSLGLGHLIPLIIPTINIATLGILIIIALLMSLIVLIILTMAILINKTSIDTAVIVK